MVVFTFDLNRAGILAATGSARAMNRVCKQVWRELGNYWHANILQRHWQSGAAARYGYAPRTPGWEKRKRQLFFRGKAEAPDKPLWFTGAMRRDIKSLATVRAYPQRFSVKMQGPYYVSMRPHPRSKMMNMGKEITTVIDAEQRELAELAMRRLPELIVQEATRVRTRKRIR